MSHRRIILTFNENEINGPKPHCPRFYFFVWKWDFSWQTLLVICQRYFEEIKSRNQVCFLLHIIRSQIVTGQQERSNWICGVEMTQPLRFHSFCISELFIHAFSQLIGKFCRPLIDHFWFSSAACGKKKIAMIKEFSSPISSICCPFPLACGNISTHRGVKRSFFFNL